jgi:hypothetical protein
MCAPWVIPAFVDAYETIVATLVEAAPAHLARRRKAFASATAIDDLIEQRAELLIAALTLDSVSSTASASRIPTSSVAAERWGSR